MPDRGDRPLPVLLKHILLQHCRPPLLQLHQFNPSKLTKKTSKTALTPWKKGNKISQYSHNNPNKCHWSEAIVHFFLLKHTLICYWWNVKVAPPGNDCTNSTPETTIPILQDRKQSSQLKAASVFTDFHGYTCSLDTWAFSLWWSAVISDSQSLIPRRACAAEAQTKMSSTWSGSKRRHKSDTLNTI
jgi:hypothetical protein